MRSARSAADAPEIDGVVRVQGARGARPGDILRVKVTAATSTTQARTSQREVADRRDTARAYAPASAQP